MPSGSRRNCPGWDVDVRPGVSLIGGGSTPEQALATWLLSIFVPNTMRFEEELRSGHPGGRRQDRRRPPGFGSRTVYENEEEELVRGADSGPFEVTAVGGIYFDSFAFIDEGRNMYNQARIGLRRFGHVRDR